MTATKIVDLLPHFALNVKNEFDTVQPEIKNPEVRASGVTNREPERIPRESNTIDSRILSGSPKSINTLGDTMTIDFLVLSPFIMQTEEWKYLSPHQVCILITLIHNCVREEYLYDLHGTKILLQRGQVCTTVRHLAEICPTDSPKNSVTRNMVETALRKFENYKWIDIEIVHPNENEQKVGRHNGRHTGRHKKTLITINDSILYDSKKQFKETYSETKKIKVGDTNIASLSISTPIPNSNYLKASLGDCGNVHNQASKQANLEIEFKKDQGKFINIPEKQMEEWKRQFPHLNVEVEIQKFAFTKPVKSKTPWGFRLLSWLQARPMMQVPEKKSENIENLMDEYKKYAENVRLTWDLNNHELDVFNDGIVLRCGMLQRDAKFEDKDFIRKFNTILRERGCKKRK